MNLNIRINLQVPNEDKTVYTVAVENITKRLHEIIRQEFPHMTDEQIRLFVTVGKLEETKAF